MVIRRWWLQKSTVISQSYIPNIINIKKFTLLLTETINKAHKYQSFGLNTAIIKVTKKLNHFQIKTKYN